MNANLKSIVKGPANLKYVLGGGIAVYELTSDEGLKYQLEIDLSDKHDVGETASFLPHYDKSLILMRWIRRAIENETLIYIGKE